jgi:hypothetical protein
MLRDDAQKLMSQVFKSGAIAHRTELVKVFVEYLKSEQERALKKEAEKGMPLAYPSKLSRVGSNLLSFVRAQDPVHWHFGHQNTCW